MDLYLCKGFMCFFYFDRELARFALPRSVETHQTHLMVKKWGLGLEAPVRHIPSVRARRISQVLGKVSHLPLPIVFHRFTDPHLLPRVFEEVRVYGTIIPQVVLLLDFCVMFHYGFVDVR